MTLDPQPTQTRSRRAGGRAARVALRAAPLAEDIRPIRAGLKGGRYQPLAEADVGRIHSAALDALEMIGLANAPASGVEILTGAGAIQGDLQRRRMTVRENARSPGATCSAVV